MGASLHAQQSLLGPSETSTFLTCCFCCCKFTHLNLEFYQLQATYTKTGRPAQWALATWAPEGPVSSA